MVGELVRRAREARGWTQTELASASPSNQNRLLRLLIERVEMLGKDERRIIWRPDVGAAFKGCE